jgi:hypothetical protein
MVFELFRDRPDGPVRILDPCVGPGTFSDAIQAEGVMKEGDAFLGLDIDPAMVQSAIASSGKSDEYGFSVADYIVTPRVSAFHLYDTFMPYDVEVRVPVAKSWPRLKRR